ncbi:LPXTG cell wall anchor domain-containing protein [Embleya sp. NPDC055664]
MKRTVGLGAAGGLLLAAPLIGAGTAGAAAGITITADSTTIIPGGRDAVATITTSAPFDLSTEGTGKTSFGWSLPEECHAETPGAHTPRCTPGPSGKVVIPVGTEEGLEGQKVTLIAKAVTGEARGTLEFTYGKPIIASNLWVSNPKEIVHAADGSITKDYTVEYADRTGKENDATVTVTAVKGITFAAAPEGCQLNTAKTTVTCHKTERIGDMPRTVRLRGTLTGNEQIVESRITGKLTDHTPADNVDRTVYTYNIGTATTAPTTPAGTGGTAATPAPPAKGRELAETGADNDNTTMLAVGAGILLVAGAGGTLFARNRRRAHQA